MVNNLDYVRRIINLEFLVNIYIIHAPDIIWLIRCEVANKTHAHFHSRKMTVDISASFRQSFERESVI
jgi:hypothetical protein